MSCIYKHPTGRYCSKEGNEGAYCPGSGSFLNCYTEDNKEVMKNTLDKFVKTNLYYSIDYDYRRSGCTCNDDICRCTTIEDSWIENIHVNNVIEELYKKYKTKNDNFVDRYCFDRICHMLKIYDKDLYEIEVTSGYYGEEVDGIYFINEKKLADCYSTVQKLNKDIDKIKYCLEFEYGYLIDSVKNTTRVSLVRLYPSELIVPQREYFHRLFTSVVDYYKDIKLPICICIKDNDKYRLIDGYHRYAANEDKETIVIIVLE